MVQYYTLEEASKILQTPPERLKEMARKNQLRAFQDRGTLRFRAQEVDEMARSRGLGSDPELQLGEPPPTQRGKGPASRKTAHAPASGALPVDEEDVLLGGESGAKTGPPSSGKRSGDSGRSAGRKKAPPAGPSDSDVRLVPEGSDVDIQVAGGGASKSGKGQPGLPTTSPFELSEDDINLAPASGKNQGSGKSSRKLTDDALPLLPDEDEVTLGELGGSGHANSGINLREPVDSGISLEQGGSDELEFDLSLEPGSSPKTNRPAETPDSSSEFELSLADEPKETPQDSTSSEFELSLDEGGEGAEAAPDSDSEFELTLDESGGLTPAEEGGEEEGKDIFESDFEEEALDQDSGAEEVPTEEEGSSEFDLDLEGGGEEAGAEVGEESGAEVDLDEELADAEAPTVARPRARAAEAGEEDEESVGDLEQELDEDELAPEPVTTAAAPPAEWGPIPAIGLLLTLPVLIIVGLMSYELVQGTTAYHRPGKLTGPVINSIARMFDDTLPKD